MKSNSCTKMSKCFRCNKDVLDDKTSFKCDGCKRLLHLTCANVTARELNCLQLQTSTRKLRYLCDDCESNYLQVPLLISLIKELQFEVKTLKAAYEDILNDKNKQINDLMKEIKDLRKPTKDMAVEEIFMEVNERINRACNLMVFNVPESSSNNIQEKIENDKVNVIDIFNKMGKSEAQQEIVKIVRVGRQQDSKLRPIKVVFSSNEVVKDLLKNKRKLFNHPAKVSYDQTNMQREMFKTVWNDLKVRKNNGESDLIIKYRNGIPKIEKTKYTKN